MKNNQKLDISNLQGKPDKLIWFDEAKVSAIIDAVKKFIERKSHYLVVRRAMTEGVAEYLTREYCKKIDSYKDVIKRSYIKSNGAVYAILRCIGSCVADSLEHQDKILRVGEALAVFDANIDAVLSGSERIMDYSQISETRRKEQQVTEDVTSKKTVDFAEALESGDMGDVERAIAESVKQKELLEKTREEAQKNQQALDIAQTNLENSKNQVSESDLYNGQIGGGVQNNTSVENINQTNMNAGFVQQPEVAGNQNAQPVGEQGQYVQPESQQQVTQAGQFGQSNNVAQPVEQPSGYQAQPVGGQFVQSQGAGNPNVQPAVGQNMTPQGAEGLNAEPFGQNVNQGQMSTQYSEPVGQPSQPYNATQTVAQNQYVQSQVAPNQFVQPEVQPQGQPAVNQYAEPNAPVTPTVQSVEQPTQNQAQPVGGQYMQSQVAENPNVQPAVQNVSQGQMGAQYSEQAGQFGQPYNATQQVAPNQFVQPEVQPQGQPADQFVQPNNIAQTVPNQNAQSYNTAQQVAPSQVVQPQVAPNQFVQPEQPTQTNNTQTNNFNQ